MNSQESYVYGLLLADGSLYLNTRNRGRVTLNISIRDKDIAIKLFNLIPGSKIYERIKDTNFKKDFQSICFNNCHKEFRDWLIECGFPIKDKTNLASPPSCEYDELSFWRGFLDGDGSLGLTSRNIPYVSLVTISDIIKETYLDFLYRRYGWKKKSTKNKRDNAYNIMVINEKAVSLSRDLYCGSDLHIDRKYQKALEIQRWIRTIPKRSKRE